jgi:hypothetical protein
MLGYVLYRRRRHRRQFPDEETVSLRSLERNAALEEEEYLNPIIRPSEGSFNSTLVFIFLSKKK